MQANSFQHLPFLQSQIQARGYKISAVGNTVTAPLGFYSKKFKSLADLTDNPKNLQIIQVEAAAAHAG